MEVDLDMSVSGRSTTLAGRDEDEEPSKSNRGRINDNNLSDLNLNSETMRRSRSNSNDQFDSTNNGAGGSDEAILHSITNLKKLVPHASPRNIYNPRTLLVVAAEGCFRSHGDLKSLTEGEGGVLVRVAKKLPLAGTTDDVSPSIDAIALVYKLNNRDSLETIKASLSYIDVKYRVGKCFILVVTDDVVCPSDTDDIQLFAEQHRLPLHFLSRPRSAAGEKCPLHIPDNLVAQYCPPLGGRVNSLLIQASLQHGALMPAPLAS